MARSVGQSDRRRRRMTTAEQETAVSLYRAGTSGPHIADRLNISADAVYRALTYTPDFWVYDSGGKLEAIIDIKGRWWPGSQQSRVAAFVSQYPHLPFEVWDAAVLKTNSVRLV